MLKVGNIAPDFKLPDQNEKIHSLSDYKGRVVFIYFYPKDDTPGCTTESCSIRDNMKVLEKLNVQVFGISADNVKSHKKFADKYKLNFPILSDAEKKVLNAYGAWGEKKFMGKTYMGILRTSFLINKNGKIVKVYEKVKPETHLEEVLNDIKNLS